MRSGPGAILSPVEEQPDIRPVSGRPITLIDSTVSRTATSSEAEPDASGVIAADSGGLPQSDFVLERRWTKQSLQQQLTQRKYAKYQEHRLIHRPTAELDDNDSLASGSSAPRRGSIGRLTRVFARKKIRPIQEQDVVIDVLYENQRGMFTLGVPHFSSNSLLNFDPKPWINAHRRTSPVNITNAQVPDPNWKWAWDSWYVDMSRDVDEQGWEYSFWFQDSAAWHGNHPWFHSFVRRRRWLRKRVRSPVSCLETERNGSRHSQGVRTEHQTALSNVTDLVQAIKACSIDRERLVTIRDFLAQPHNDIHDLTDEMPHIMSLFLFQESRKTLVDILLASTTNEQPEASDSDRRSQLQCAMNSAKRQANRLEYWSDVKSAAIQTADIVNEPGSSTSEHHDHDHHTEGGDRLLEHRQPDDSGYISDSRDKGKGRQHDDSA